MAESMDEVWKESLDTLNSHYPRLRDKIVEILENYLEEFEL